MHNSSNNRIAAICSKANYRWVFGILFLFTMLVFARFALPVSAAMSNADDSMTIESENSFFHPSEGFADVIEHVSPAIVSIEVISTAYHDSKQSHSESLKEFFFRHRPFEMPSPFDKFKKDRFSGYGAKFKPPVKGSGTGVIFHPAGYIVTNTHVIKDATEISVTLSDGSQYEAKLVAGDHRTDIAALKIEVDEDLPFAEFGDSDQLRVGDWVIAMGDGFGFIRSASVGILSGMDRVVSTSAEPYTPMLQFDAAINKGNSGGPLINTKGEIIGITTLIYSPSGAHVGLGFAVPSNTVRFITSTIMESGKVDYGYLGVFIQPVDKNLAKMFKLPDSKATGVLISSIEENSPVESILKVGEIVLKYEGNEVRSVDDLVNYVQSSRPGELVQLQTWHEGELRTVTVRIGAKEGDMLVKSSTTDDSSSLSNLLGLHVGEIDENHRRELQLDESVNGLLVLDVEPSSTAELAGLQPGDVIREIDDRSFTAIDDAMQYLGEKQRVLMYVHRNGIDQFLVFDSKDLS